MMTEEDCDLLIKNNEKIRKLLEKGNANKYLTFKEINGAIDNMDTDVMDILFQLLLQFMVMKPYIVVLMANYFHHLLNLYHQHHLYI